MALTRILISVKTYPTLSATYDELVCTAGFKEDGSWVRIYPVPYRKLNYADQYEKWQWIEMDIVRNTKDFRKESYRPADLDKDIIIGEKVPTTKNWALRKEIVLKNVYTDMSVLIGEAKDKDIGTSLAVLKPKKVIDFIWEPCGREWDKNKLDTIIAKQAQGNLFDNEETKKIFKVAKKLPYRFSYVFTTDDNITRTLMVEDWELGALYWNCLRAAEGNEAIACQKVKEKYFDHMVNKCDLHFFLGTTQKFHNVGLNPFIIIGVFYPPKEDKTQLSLF
ncbi:MAG TPA: hypothetical protein PK155_04190 [Bacteroidales bacterium]|jgi:hypothetical protein|uniref:Uncharacterized protein n=1 Tax=Candidatus Atribacter allofermentans TaxID=1852833 RepID=A0A1V5SPU3_9BACT|nr:MAG: hypothetical protein BWY41_01541 [Candidatus Atribacteria bacterium ADurb.Bin276]HQA93214.1 hypothetical protein [Bacteroidales bacterium]